jgi:hypothetical protein
MRPSVWLVVCGVLGAFAAIDAGCGQTSGSSDGGVDAASDGNLQFGDAATATLTIDPPTATLHASGSPLTQAFTAYDQNHVAVKASWSLDNVQLGAIDPNGVFTTPGTLGGGATVTAQYGNSVATATIAVDLTMSENPGNLSAQTIALLQQGGSADPAFKWLYPYDKTVFPRGLTAPLLQFPGAVDAAWVHAETASKSIVYDGYFGASNPARVQWSDPTWKILSLAPIGGSDPLTVKVTKLSGTAVTGPISETWTIAPGTLRGVLYYNSYTSALAGSGVLRLKPGGTATALSGSCTVCHTVSTKGNALFAALNDNTGTTGAKYDLTGDAGATVLGTKPGYTYQMAGIYPDGTLLLSNTGHRIPRMGFNVPALYDTSNGQKLAAPGFDGVITYANTPVFSDDGTEIAFNNGVQNDGGAGSSMAVMDFDVKSKTFSNLSVLTTSPGTELLGWPTFLPDGKSVVYDHYLGPTSSGAYLCGDPNGLCYDSRGGQTSVIEMVDRATKTVTHLDELSGFDNGQLYLPFGAAEDEHFDFEPTALPLAVGGYYWVVFGTRRHYGNVTNVSQTDDRRMKLWVAAIDLNYKPGTDPSHPAFYLPGQEDGAGNMRGYWVLPACEQNGQTCTGGDECCSGFCVQQTVDGGTQGVCGTTTGCAHELDKCTVDGDCCASSSGARCINGYCTTIQPK